MSKVVQAKPVEPKMTRLPEDLTPVVQGVIARAQELGVPWFVGDPKALVRAEGGRVVSFEGHMRNVEDIRADIRTALKRDERRRYRGHYLRFALGRGEVTLYAARFPGGGPQTWRVGWSWRNPDDVSLAKRGRVGARAAAILWESPVRGDPPWEAIIEWLVVSAMTGDLNLPTWFHRGGFASRVDCTCNLFNRATEAVGRQAHKRVTL